MAARGAPLEAGAPAPRQPEGCRIAGAVPPELEADRDPHPIGHVDREPHAGGEAIENVPALTGRRRGAARREERSVARHEHREPLRDVITDRDAHPRTRRAETLQAT